MCGGNQLSSTSVATVSTNQEDHKTSLLTATQMEGNDSHTDDQHVGTLLDDSPLSLSELHGTPQFYISDEGLEDTVSTLSTRSTLSESPSDYYMSDAEDDDNPNLNFDMIFGELDGGNGCVSGSRSDSPKSCKSVSFADDMGYSLVQVKEFEQDASHFDSPFNSPFGTPTAQQLQSHMSPMIRYFMQSYCDSQRPVFSSPAVLNRSTVTHRSLHLFFAQPISNYAQFIKQLTTTNVAVESVVVQHLSVIGTVRVRNLCYEKQVSVRVSDDSWTSHRDYDAVYSNSSYPDFDIFSFHFDVSPNLSVGTAVEFAVYFKCKAGEFWDNFLGQNFVILVR